MRHILFSMSLNAMRLSLCMIFCAAGYVGLHAQWRPAGNRIATQWTSDVDSTDVLPEYPRPLLERQEWANLNGMWDYAILPVGQKMPERYDGRILVPFAVESALSGVGKYLGDENELWYRRRFDVPKSWNGRRVLLHFGAVDWKTTVWVNGVKAGEHRGGFTPFDFDVTDALLRGGDNEIVVRVWDPTDKGPQPRGKQVSVPGHIWYTPVSGIWQTVWLEPVAPRSIASLRTTPDIDAGKIHMDVALRGACDGCRVEAKVMYDGSEVAVASALNGAPLEIAMPGDFKLWSPDSPELYDVEVYLYDGKKIVDKVKSYAAMRKYSTRRDAAGYVRLQLNNKDLFQFGPLDQGWWPDGLYTAPTDEAMEYDIRVMKDLGFNMIRKHIKVEPARWYACCDRIGMIVWQDMPNGDRNQDWQYKQYYYGPEPVRSSESETIYRNELKDMMDYLHSYPCIGMWVPFNEAMGQFKSVEITDWVKAYDPSRPVNSASGGNYYPSGDVLDLHSYPEPIMFLFDGERANVIGEFGGIGMALKGHLWDSERNWGYGDLKGREDATNQYVQYASKLCTLAPLGLCGAVYTQLTDVEVEINGLMTYDRKVMKLDEAAVRKVNAEACRSLADNK